jgi:hypothetical protein
MRESIDVALAELCEIYDKKRTKSLEKYWTIGLAKYRDEQIIKALKGYYERNESHFFPTPAEFIRYKFQAPSM